MSFDVFCELAECTHLHTESVLFYTLYIVYLLSLTCDFIGASIIKLQTHLVNQNASLIIIMIINNKNYNKSNNNLLLLCFFFY